MIRRNFLKSGALATTALLMPRFLKSVEMPGVLPFKGKSLVIIQFSGGNDGLNTIIPVRNDVYYRERPGLGIQRQTALSL
ncbi:MAG: twin-arginine translocation pathway signal, partial [Saprospiraceae bacterium]|nr:twin-arginine translocation pathway signal [Saprospiraceae bacterium]